MESACGAKKNPPFSGALRDAATTLLGRQIAAAIHREDLCAVDVFR